MWFIQLGSFTAESNAQNLLAQVQRAGVSARVEKIDVNGNSVWRVSSGSYATREEADAALGRLKARLNLGGMVKQVR
jgi:cell division protein FtsN